MAELERMMNHSYSDLENDSYYYDYEYDWDEEPQSTASPHALHLVSIVLYSVAFILGVPGNALVIWFTGFKWEKTVSTLWFLNLAIADLIFVLFLPLHITYVALDFHWCFGKLLCKVNSFVALLNMFASIFFLTVISLDRLVQLVHPNFSQKHRTLKNSLFLSSAVWLFSAVNAGPALYFRDTAYRGNNGIVCYNNFHHDRDIVIRTHMILSWTRLLLGYLFPLVTMILCYTSMAIKVKKGAVLTSGKFFWTVFAVVVAFFICWTPYHIFNILELAIHHNTHFHQLVRIGMPLATSLAFINSCLNPILYVLISKMFKIQFKMSVGELLKHTLREISQSGTMSEHLRDSETNVNLCETAQ
ncbi:chemerin-like receptor 2 [Pleurodeles waltl]|uniref:chemerin-like receptor 2 n=1 Tax=Pleurodeles waltl TaxID=8319 RepID=UPI003709BE41